MLKEFKEFASKGNFVDMAIGIIMGGAVGAVVQSIVDILMEIISALAFGQGLENLSVTIAGVPIAYGTTLNALINFLIIAFTMFLIVKAINRMNALVPAAEVVEEAPTTKVCPFCKTEISIEATRCPNCTSHLD